MPQAYQETWYYCACIFMNMMIIGIECALPPPPVPQWPAPHPPYYPPLYPPPYPPPPLPLPVPSPPNPFPPNPPPFTSSTRPPLPPPLPQPFMLAFSSVQTIRSYFTMDFTSLSANATKLAQFKIGINSQLSKASSVSYEDVLLLTLMAGSAVADNNISFPAVNFTSAQALATATTLCLFPNNTFSPQFLQEYGISKVTMVALSLSSPLPPSAPSSPSSFSSPSSSSSQFNTLSIVGVALGGAAFLGVLVIALFLIIHRYNRSVAPEQLEVSGQTMQKMVGHAVQEVVSDITAGGSQDQAADVYFSSGQTSPGNAFHKPPVLIHVLPKGIAAQLGQGQGSTQAVRDAAFLRAQAAARWAPGGHPMIAEFNAAGSSLAKPVTGVSAEVRQEGEELRVVAPDPIKVPSSAADTAGEVIKLTKKSVKRKKPAVVVDQAAPVDPPLSAVETVLPMKEADVPYEAKQASSNPPPPAAAGPKATNKPVKVKKVKPRNETLTSLGDPIDS